MCRRTLEPKQVANAAKFADKARLAVTRAFRGIRIVVSGRGALATNRLELRPRESEIGIRDAHIAVGDKSAHEIRGLLTTQTSFSCVW
jgi:hypothetical protein